VFFFKVQEGANVSTILPHNDAQNNCNSYSLLTYSLLFSILFGVVLRCVVKVAAFSFMRSEIEDEVDNEREGR
jgi:hypothetical protein